MLKGDWIKKLGIHLIVVFLATMIMGFFALITVLAKPLAPVEEAIKNFSFTDIYYSIMAQTGEPEKSHLITIVDLTRLTNRSDIAKTLEDIESGKPAVLGLDCVFDNEGEDLDANADLISTIEKYDNMVFSLKFLDWENEQKGFTKAIHSYFAEFIDIKEGTSNMPRGGLYDSMKRKVPRAEKLNGKWHPSLCAEIANCYAKRDVTKGKTEDLNINFSPMEFTVLDPEEVSAHPELIKDRIVLLGSIYEDSDCHWTPVGKIAGVELLAYGIQSLITDKEVYQVPQTYFWMISLLIVLLVQIMQTNYLSHTIKSKNIFVRFVLGSTYILGIITFLFTSVFIGITFLLFKFYNVSFNLAWSMSVIAFLTTSRYMFAALKEYANAYAEQHPKIKEFFLSKWSK